MDYGVQVYVCIAVCIHGVTWPVDRVERSSNIKKRQRQTAMLT